MGLAEVVEVEPVDSGDWDIIRLNQSGERPGEFQQTQPIRQYRDMGTLQDLTYQRSLWQRIKLNQSYNYYEIFKGGILLDFFYVLYSTLLHLLSLRFRCARGC